MMELASSPCKPVGQQSWRDLTFVHWRAPAAEIQSRLPSSLEVDTFDGSAWLGLVLFRMANVRTRWFPPGCRLAPFFETNVRTYVHRAGREPGVYFFSLDASHRLAVWAARKFWSLNYVWAQMSIERNAATVKYRGQRPGGAHCRVAVELLDQSSLSASQPVHATAGSAEHFLIERYDLYVVRKGTLMRARVRHKPYPLEAAQLVELDETLLAANSLRPPAAPCHTVFSPGVDVDVFGLMPASDATEQRC